MLVNLHSGWKFLHATVTGNINSNCSKSGTHNLPYATSKLVDPRGIILNSSGMIMLGIFWNIRIFSDYRKQQIEIHSLNILILIYRILYRTKPLGKIRMYTFGIIMLWKCPSFSFEKNRSGIQTRLASVNVKYFRRPAILWRNTYDEIQL